MHFFKKTEFLMQLGLWCADLLCCACSSMLVFQNYDPNFMAASLDEAYLDITEVCKEREITGEEVSFCHHFVILTASV